MSSAFDWKRFLLSFDGRIGRYDYWMRFYIPYTVIMIILGLLESYGPEQAPFFSFVFLIAASWPSLAVGIKRCHDRNRSGWFLLIGLIPIIGSIWLLIELGFLRGTIGPNRYGPDPVPVMTAPAIL